MSNGIQIDVKVDFKSAARWFTESVFHDMVQESLAQGGAIIAKEAKINAPVDTRALQRSIHVAGHTDLTPDFQGEPLVPPSSKLEVKIGTTVSYAAVQEYGCGPIYPVKSNVLSWIDKNTGERVFAAWTRGVPPHPYMRPALDNKRQEVLQKVADTLERQFAQKAARP